MARLQEAQAQHADVTLLRAAHSLRTDRATAAVAKAFIDAGLPSLLLKGPAIVTLLYPHDSRPYEDCDLLVPEGDLSAAGEVLLGLGFVLGIDPQDDLVASWQRHSQTWVRQADHVCVELHWTLTHVAAPPDRAWAVLAHDAATTPVCGVEVATPAPAQLAAIIALHVAAHGSVTPQPVEDLERALVHFDRPVWEQAADVAEELDAAGAFAAGLRRLEAGRHLAEALGLDAAQPRRVALTNAHVPARARLGATLIEELAHMPTMRARAALMVRALFPSPAFMRLNDKPLARRGRVGLAASYVVRPLDLARKAGPAWLAWWRARGKATSGG